MFFYSQETFSALVAHVEPVLPDKTKFLPPALRLLAAEGEGVVVDDVGDGGVAEGDGGVDGRVGVSDIDSIKQRENGRFGRENGRFGRERGRFWADVDSMHLGDTLGSLLSRKMT